MTPEYAIGLLGRLIETAALLSAPVLLAGLVVGVAVALIQAVTQVHEASLSFVPKAAVMAALLLWGAPWFVERLTAFTSDVAAEMSRVGRRNP